MHTTSLSLLERLRQPADRQAWARFFDLYTPLLYYWACRLGLQPADAGDLVQEVFTALLQALPRFRYDERKSFRGWLRTVLVNKWREGRRGQAACRPAGGTPLPDPAGPDNVAELEDEEFRHYLALRALQLMQAEFQPATWKACWECVVGGRPAPEVARELGLTVNAVYLAKSRVLRRLRQELEGLLD
jgi:RNA polymerase sigma-70 factor (ECF subfamily)